MKLKWHIHGDHCLTLETGGGRAIPSIEWQGEALRRVSAGWNREPDIHTLDYWLRGGLPENGGFLAFERRAQETLSDREMSIGHGTLHDWVWANANWEYPGAITFEREEEDGRTEEPDGYVKINDEEAGEKLREAADEADVARALRPRNPHPPKSSLSGAQGKIAVHIDENGRM